MKIINRSRGSGKTTILIHTAYATGKPIIVSSQERKKYVLEMAEKMKTPVEVYNIEEWIKLLSVIRQPSALIDDMEDFLEPALNNYFGTKVDAATTTIPVDNIKGSENPDRKHGKWEKLTNCSNEGVSCSVCHRKVFKLYYENQALQSKYCPNCGAKMDSLED